MDWQSFKLEQESQRRDMIFRLDWARMTLAQKVLHVIVMALGAIIAVMVPVLLFTLLLMAIHS